VLDGIRIGNTYKTAILMAQGYVMPTECSVLKYNCVAHLLLIRISQLFMQVVESIQSDLEPIELFIVR
jgi:hypothetical protein